MPKCLVCGETSHVGFEYTCNYCGLRFCSTHRLPENHDCAALNQANTLGPDFRKTSGEESDTVVSNTIRKVIGEEQQMDSDARSDARRKTSAEKGSDGSPDLNPDGTLQSKTRAVSESGSIGHWFGKFVYDVTHVLPLQIRSFARTMLRLTGICLVLLGGYNFLLSDVVTVGVFLGVYREFISVYVFGSTGYSHLADVVLMSIGAAITWFL